MNNWIKGLAFLFIGLTVQAQDAQKAKKLLDEVSKKVKTYNNMVIDFKYSLQNAKENINQESKGKVAIENLKSNKYVLDFMGVTKIHDGKKSYVIVPEDEEITISSEKSADNSITPDKMLTFFEKGYTFSWDILQNVGGRKIQLIKLKPTNAKDPRKEIYIGIDTQTKHIYSLIEVDKKGTKTTLIVNSFKTNQPLSKNHFTFVESKYPNYYINRLD